MRIFERLKLVCEYQGWKLKDFSAITELPYRTAQGYLSGDREPNAEGMTAICIKANVNLNWLLTGNGSMFIDATEQVRTLTKNEEHLLAQYQKCNEMGEKAILLNVNAISSEQAFQK